MSARTALCDLLIGRALRLQAAELLDVTIEAETSGYTAPWLSTGLESAAHMEGIAVRAEQGQICWGGRFNRCGYHAHQIDKDTLALTWIDVARRGAA